jgi:hypothetical protein
MATIYEPGLFKVRLFHESLSAPGDPWVTNHTFNTADETISSVADATAGTMANWESYFYGDDVVTNYATVSTYEAEEGDYDPDHFKVLPFGTSVIGRREVDNLYADRNIVLNFRRAVQAGHQGKIALRGALFYNEVGSVAAGGKMALTAAARITLNTALEEAAEELAGLMVGDGGDAVMVMVSAGPGGTQVIRPVQFITLRGPSTNNANHKYFNRGA